MSIALGGLASLIKHRFSWILIISVPMASILLLNNYYTDLPQDGATIENAAYIFIGGPSIVIAFLSYLLLKSFKNKNK
jgi:hypothetical protein